MKSAMNMAGMACGDCSALLEQTFEHVTFNVAAT